jgi:hypothetical protein
MFVASLERGMIEGMMRRASVRLEPIRAVRGDRFGDCMMARAARRFGCGRDRLRGQRKDE